MVIYIFSLESSLEWRLFKSFYPFLIVLCYGLSTFPIGSHMGNLVLSVVRLESSWTIKKWKLIVVTRSLEALLSGRINVVQVGPQVLLEKRNLPLPTFWLSVLPRGLSLLKVLYYDVICHLMPPRRPLPKAKSMRPLGLNFQLLKLWAK